MPEGGGAAGRQGQAGAEVAGVAGGEFMAVVVQGVEVDAGTGAAAGAWLEGEQAEVAEAGGDGPAGLGLPPVVDHRLAKQVRGPDRGGRVTALAGEEQG